ncbi:hypothetical protein BJN45_03030 [Azonexus hydrophilus]|uniref:Sel1 repeat family protein n=2 Tax=Azonexus hydrophilus TaxID=418702 RepID=A0A1R1ICV1_9RHOO|nr:hypothetical protein BJN45_03030 [Azonexus hydrophilus]
MKAKAGEQVMAERYDFFGHVENAIATGEKGRLEGCYAAAISLKAKDPDLSNKILFRLLEGGYQDVNRELFERYLNGDSLPVDHAKALSHLVAWAESGSAPGMFLLGEAYEHCGESRRDGVKLVEHDIEEAKKWYRRSAELDYSLSAKKLADLLLDGRRARDCTQKELEDIEKYYIKAGEYFTLGNIYCSDKHSPDCTPEELLKAKQWYAVGRKTGMGSFQCQECTEILRKWDEPEYVPPRDNSITATEVIVAPIALWLWGAIGTALLGVVMAINAVTIPLLIGGAIVYGLYKLFKSSR